jgi:hypothetical protein
MNEFQTADLILGVIYQGEELALAYTRLATGITARAEKEGRDVTADEQTGITAALDAAEKVRKGL